MKNNPLGNIDYSGTVILVEGSDDEKLIRNINDSGASLNIINLKGYSSLSERLNNISIRTNTFKNEIQKLLIIVDADDNYSQRAAEIKQILAQNNLSLPDDYVFGSIVSVSNIQLGIFILPDNSSEGSLETLMLKSVKHSDLLECTEKQIDCRNTKENNILVNRTKNQIDKVKWRLHMNLLVIDYNFTYEKTLLDEINYQHDCYKKLKEFIS